MKRAREAEADYEVDRWTAAHGNAVQLLILDAEAAVLAQDGQDRFAA